MLCRNCSLKNECKSLCQDVKQYLNSKRNYKTTYVNKEVGSSSLCEDMAGYYNWLTETISENIDNRSNYYKKYLPRVNDIIANQLTDKQKKVMKMHFFKGMGLSEIGRVLNVSEQAVYQTIYGHPTQGGGAIKKIGKILKTTCR